MIVTVLLQGGVANIVSTTPEDAAKDFLEGLKNNEPQVMEKYMDNSYINFICNVEGDEGVVDRMDDALLQNFSYEVDKVAAKDDVERQVSGSLCAADRGSILRGDCGDRDLSAYGG